MGTRGGRGLWRYLLGALLACGAGQGGGVALEGSTACERYASLARAKGCELRSCNIAPSCDAPATALVNCMATDLDQCLCESDGDLNCEGAYKANEGPAHCIAENQAFEACAGP